MMGPLVALVTLVTAFASAVSGPQTDLIERLRRGGYVLVMRHAHAPREAPAKDQANRDNVRLERQLDEAGRQGATAMGEAIRAERIPIGAVFTSPTYRARETVKLARLGEPTIVEELGDGGQSMQGVTEAQAAWLRTRVSEAPTSGNTLLVTHQPNLSRAFPDWGGSVADGETVVLRPEGNGRIVIVGRIRIDEWPR
jgi:phosphohistidine phosphatase SixA